MRILKILLFGIAVSGAMPAYAAPDELEAVIVTATRVARSPFEIGASVDSVAIRRDSLGINLSESLGAVAGLAIRDRQNYAQDAQLSIRGFGARSTFGIRGVRLVVDDIPATQPDGQGQISQLNLATAARVEVLRGPYSSLYGNSSGGVVQLFTADGSGSPSLNASIANGSFATRRASLQTQGERDLDATDLKFNLGYTRFDTDGARGHSSAERDSVQGKATLTGASGAKLRFLFNSLRAPDAGDPLGLTAIQFDADPYQAAPAALQFNTRKSVRQNQGGVVYDSAAHAWGNARLMVYDGSRGITQFLAIPVATQSDPRHSGGVVDLGSHFSGGELRWQDDFPMRTGAASMTAGLSYDLLNQRRRGYENFQGTTPGIVGNMRRDEDNNVRSLDQYLQLEWPLAADWQLSSGLRHSEIAFRSDDHYIRVGNPDDSGSANYSATVPMASLLWRAAPDWHWYAATGTGFETPTLVELAYRSDGRAGLNFDLSDARTQQSELGVKWQHDAANHAEFALFNADSRRELVVVSNSGGRAAYANAGRTNRRGIEFQAAGTLDRAFGWQLAYTVLRAEVRDAYNTCSAAPCVIPNVFVAPGSRIPGVPATQSYGELSWKVSHDWKLVTAARSVAEVPANDVNSVMAGSYATADVSLSYQFAGERLDLQAFARLDNVFDRRYAGSVIVNDANGRFFEAAAGRNATLGFTAQLR